MFSNNSEIFVARIIRMEYRGLVFCYRHRIDFYWCDSIYARKMITEDTCIYDIETHTFGLPNPEKDELRIFGCYSYKTNKSYLLTDKNEIQKFINAHKYLIGFNNKNYDNIILEREGISLKWKCIIDLMEIFKKRAGGMKIKKGMLGNLLMKYSLDYITKTLDIVNNDSGKKEIDYSIFRKPAWSKEEIEEIGEYTKRDIEVTKKLYEWVEEYFKAFKKFVNEKDIENKSYLTCSLACFAYKAVCKEMGWNEEYDDANYEANTSYKGGYVAYPAGEMFEDNIAYYDFSSLYPNLFIQFNLFGHNCNCCEEYEKWHGNDMFKVEGYYCKKNLNNICKLLQKFFLMRKEMKKNKDDGQMTVKIIINSLYGASASKSFRHIYNPVGAADCTSLGRQCIKYVRKRFGQEGYINIMSDTDSVVVKLPEGKTIEESNMLAKQIRDELQDNMLFPW
jgi:hypothetical protein